MWRALSFAKRVHVLHHRGHSGVVAETRKVFADLANCLMELPHHRVVWLAVARHVLNRCEKSIEKTARAGNAGISKVASLLVRPQEHEVAAESVRAPLLDVL